MPKYAYHKYYGALSMFPFYFNWLAVLALPFLVIIKDKGTLKQINDWCLNIVYFPVALTVLAVFMIVNLVLLPFAYLMTVVHKAMLLKRYKSSNQCQSLGLFIVLGIPILLIAQFADAYRFLVHSYSTNER